MLTPSRLFVFSSVFSVCVSQRKIEELPTSTTRSIQFYSSSHHSHSPSTPYTMQLKVMSASLAATLGLAIAEISCLTQEDCEMKSQEMKMESFNPGIFPTKGCYSKNNNAFFSLGTEDEMSNPDLPGVQERIWCAEGNEMPPATNHTACLTEEDCAKKSQEMVGMIPGMVSFNPGNYPTKGCFFKNNNAFFSPGTEEEMSTPDLPGVQERIWCDVSTTASTSAPTSSLTKSPSAETVLTSAMPTNVSLILGNSYLQ